MALFRQIGPTLDPKVADALADFDKLRSKRRPSRSERQRISEFRKIVLGRSDELREQARGMMVQAGADELTPGFPLNEADDGRNLSVRKPRPHSGARPRSQVLRS